VIEVQMRGNHHVDVRGCDAAEASDASRLTARSIP
jgi:hypothetical protein